MSFLKKVGRTIISGLGGGLLGLGLSALFGKKKQQPALPPPVTRDDAATLAAREDEIRRRKGASADIVAGSGSAPGGIGKLIVGS